MAKIGDIRSAISRNSAELKEGGVAALGALVLGAGKTEAAMIGLGQTLISKVVGPLGKVVGITAMATKGLYNLTKAWATMGTGAAAKLETVQNQLRVMLKGLDAAKQRVQELRKFSIVTPFKLPDIVEGNRALQSLTRGALVTQKAMTMVGDAAAQAGVGFNDMAVYVGRLYDGLRGGRPVGEVLFRLAELGVISGQARTALENLQASGAGFSEVWRVVESELGRSQGTMAYTSKTLEGLQSTLEDTHDEIKAAFSENFLEGQKAAIEAQIRALENIKPVVEGISSSFSSVVSVASRLGSEVAAFATGIPGAAKALEFLARMAGLAAAGLTALAVATGAANMAAKLSALAGASSLAGRALAGLGTAAKGLAFVLTRLATGPFLALTVALMAGRALWTQYYDKVEKAAKALREYRGATDAMLAGMQAQRDAIKSLDDLAAGYIDTLDQLSQAYRDEAAARHEAETGGMFGEAEAIRKQIAAMERQARLKEELARLDAVNRGTLQKNAFVAENEAALDRNKRTERQAQIEADRQTMSPMARAESYRREADELARRRGAALTENTQIQDYERTKAAMGVKLAKNKAAQAEAERERQANLGNSSGTLEGYDAAVAKLEKLKAEEKALLEQELKLAEAQDSQIVKLQERISMYAKYQAAVQAVNAAEVKLREAEKDGGDVQGAKDALKRAQEQRDMLEGVAGAAGLTPAQVQQMQAEVERRKAELQGDLLNRPEEIAARARAEQEQRQRKRAIAESGQDTRVKMAEEDRGAMAAAEEQLRVELERLDLQKEYKEIDDEVYQNRKAGLEAERRMLALRKAMATQENAGDQAASMLDLKAKVARMRGRGDEARRLTEQAERAREEAGREGRIKDLMDRTGMSRQEAAAQVQGDINRERGGRALDREGGLLQALLSRGQVVDSMQRIGGGGGAGGGPNIKDVVDRLDKLIKAVEDGKEIDLRLN